MIRIEESNEITYEDIEFIQDCVAIVGELYSSLKLPFNASQDEIKREYNELRSSFTISLNDSRLEDKLRPIFEKGLISCDNIYKILSNSKLKDFYDNQILLKLINDKKDEYDQGDEVDECDECDDKLNNIDDTSNDLLKYIFNILASQLYPITQLIQTKVISKPNNINSTFQVIKLMYKENGLLAFFKNTPLLCIHLPIVLLNDHFIDLLFDKIYKNNNSSSLIKSYTSPIVSSILRYPTKFIIDCICLAPYSMSTIQVIKKILFKQQNGSGGRINFSNLFYALGSNLAIYAILRVVNYSIQTIGNKLKLKSINEINNKSLKSKIWRYTSFTYNNPITMGIISALLIYPIQTIQFQYPYEFVQSFLTNSPTPKPINPISMAIKLYKQPNGFKNLYNGILTLGLPIQIISSFYKL